MVQYISFTYNKFHTKHSLSSFSLRQLFSFRCQVFLLERKRGSGRVKERERVEELTQSKKSVATATTAVASGVVLEEKLLLPLSHFSNSPSPSHPSACVSKQNLNEVCGLYADFLPWLCL